jgi:hypothetical protein
VAVGQKAPGGDDLAAPANRQAHARSFRPGRPTRSRRNALLFHEHREADRTRLRTRFVQLISSMRIIGGKYNSRR